MNVFLADGQLLVVETDHDRYLGTVEVVGATAVIRNGYVGRPTVVDLTEVNRVTPAADHPDFDD